MFWNKEKNFPKKEKPSILFHLDFTGTISGRICTTCNVWRVVIPYLTSFFRAGILNSRLPCERLSATVRVGNIKNNFYENIVYGLYYRFTRIYCCFFSFLEKPSIVSEISISLKFRLVSIYDVYNVDGDRGVLRNV